MTKEYTTEDLNGIIEETHPDNYARQTGALRSTLSSVLTHVKVYDPKMFQEIMQFEMRCQERMKALEELAEADAEAGLL